MLKKILRFIMVSISLIFVIISIPFLLIGIILLGISTYFNDDIKGISYGNSIIIHPQLPSLK